MTENVLNDAYLTIFKELGQIQKEQEEIRQALNKITEYLNEKEQ